MHRAQTQCVTRYHGQKRRAAVAGRCASLLYFGLVGLLLMPVSLVRAEGSAKADRDPPGYKETIERALEEYSLNHFAEAREQFMRAHTLLPNARTLRGLGFAEFELRNYVESVSYLEQALGSRVRPLEGALLRDTQDLLQRARGYVGELRLSVEPADAVVTLDGMEALQAGRDAVRLNVGDHVLEVRADGYAPERRTIKVNGGRQHSLTVTLTALSAGPAAAPNAAQASASPATSPVEAAPSERRPLYKRWWLWTTVAVVVAGAAAGTALWLTADKQERYQAAPSANTPSGASLQPLVRY